MMNSLRRLSFLKVLKKDSFSNRTKGRVFARKNNEFEPSHHFGTLINCKKKSSSFYCMTVAYRYSTNVIKNQVGKNFRENKDEGKHEVKDEDEDEDEEYEGKYEHEDEHTTSQEEESTTHKIFEEIAAGDPSKLKALKILEFEISLLREGGKKVPEELRKRHWEELLTLDTISKRNKFLAFLHLNEAKQYSYQQKVASRHKLADIIKQTSGFQYYGLAGHTMFMRIYEQDIFKLLIPRLHKSELNVVFDCSYTDYMSRLNTKNCVRQIIYSLSSLRLHKYPCKMTFCKVHEGSDFGALLEKSCPGFFKEPFFDVNSKSFLDLFPREKLVYLSPHAKNDLQEINHDDVYIIGAFVDKGLGVKASLAKAKEDGIRMAKFPLDQYLIWKQGTKSLAVNVVLDILLDMAFYNDWRLAFKNIPSRFVQN